MKLLSAILFLSLMFVSGRSQAVKLQDDSFRRDGFVQLGPGAIQMAAPGEGFFDDQDSNDLDNTAGFFVASESYRFQCEEPVTLIPETIPFIYHVRISQFLIDLPPPLLL